MMSCVNHPVGRYWKFFVIILTPLILLLPLLLIPHETLPAKANQCLYVMLLMAVYWCTEVLPLAVTALIPIFLFPMLSILTTEQVSNQYLKDTVMMFVGGLMVALAVEKCDLHRRIAVSILYRVGTKPMWLMLGFMLPTWFLSMWISNTATTAMMLPIVEAVLESLTRSSKDEALQDNDGDNTRMQDLQVLHEVMNRIWAGKRRRKASDLMTIETTVDARTLPNCVSSDLPVRDSGVVQEDGGFVNMSFVGIEGDTHTHPDMINIHDRSRRTPEKHTHDEQEHDHLGHKHASSDEDSDHVGLKITGKKHFDKFAKGMTLAIAYAANTGGTATLIGTAPNPIMKGHADDIWELKGYDESPVNFASWIVYGFPLATINLVFVWLWLTVFFNGCRGLCPCSHTMNKEDEAIKRVIRREYESLGKITYAEVTVTFMFISMVLLWFFRSPNFINGWADMDAFVPGYTDDAVVSIFIAFLLCIIPSELPKCKNAPTGHVDTLLDWQTVQQKLPWGVIFLMGGGFSLARASTESGLSDWIAEQLTVMASWPGWVMVLVLSLIVTFLTEITSNSATCTILLPIASSLAEGLGRNPLYLMFPVAFSTSFAFMLPVATPPNAIAFSYGRIRIIDMMKAGLPLNFICTGVLVLANHTWADAFFGFDTIPWATNKTTVGSTDTP